MTLTDAHVPLKDVSPRLNREMGSLESISDLFQTLKRIDWRRATSESDPIIEQAARVLEDQPSTSIKSLRVSWSERHFRRRFYEDVGLAPKRFARTMRLAIALNLNSYSTPNLAALAAHAGYADQAHFCRDARAISGLMPRELLEQIGRVTR